MEKLPEFFMNHWPMFVALAIVLALLARSFLAGTFGGYTRATPQKLVTLMNHDDTTVIDIRKDSEFGEGHIINSINVPLDSLRDNLPGRLNSKELPVVMVCKTGQRSATACGILKKEGFQAIYNLEGGLTAWQSASLPLTRN